MRIFILTACLLLTACNLVDIGGDRDDGPSRTYSVSAFTGITLAGPYNVVVTQGPNFAVRAEGDPHILDRLTIRTEDGELWIGDKRRVGFAVGDHGKATVYVTAPALARLIIAGSGDVHIDKIQGDSFEGAISGSGDLRIDALHVREAELSIAGSGDLQAAGQVERAKFSIAGSGDVNAGGLQSRIASLAITGSGDAVAQASETASISIMGSGDVEVKGTAKCTINKLGSGEVRCGQG